jgi:hypothetical protein
MRYVRKQRLLTSEQLQNYKDYGRKGSKARWDQWLPVRAFAVKLAMEGQFDKRTKAARAIAPAVIDFAAGLGLLMCMYHAPVTIARWLDAAHIASSNP